MRGGSFLRRPLPHVADDARMEAAKDDVALSNVCRDIEARLVAEGASIEQWQEYEEARGRHSRRIYGGVRAG